ncbi:MAG: thioredoxin domain-containing protein, partial [Thaumarchaeota archaeon]|nr:thioredoxin domain-containing protein [Nitrososphaerota archaeon]
DILGSNALGNDTPGDVMIANVDVPRAHDLCIVSVDDDPVKGNFHAPVVIIEFSDFECPFCGAFFSDTLPLIEAEYIADGMASFVYRDFPLGFHANAMQAHMAAECADEQGQFWEYHDILFENNVWKVDTEPNLAGIFSGYADDVKLDADLFNHCMISDHIRDEILHDIDDGAKYGVSGTPTFFIGNDDVGYEKIVGAHPFETFKDVIERKLSQ